MDHAAVSAPNGQPSCGSTFHKWEELGLALAITLCASTLPRWRVVTYLWRHDVGGLRSIPWPWYYELVLLLLGLALVLPTRRRSGLQIGRLRQYRLRVLMISLLVIGTVAVVYPNLPTRPWAKASPEMWTLSPFVQDLIFVGYLYGRLLRAFPGYVHPAVPLDRALCIVVAFFAFWHVPNFFVLPAGYVFFQLLYTSVGAIVPGLTRQWTGSIFPVVFLHSATNFIAWAAG
jgi:membrane protease YdiL (CAAX protease family)